MVPKSKDSLHRATASRAIPGTGLGPYRYFGRRSDDPNDFVPHEHRRDLRGLAFVSAWIGHDDSRAINTYDALIEEALAGLDLRGWRVTEVLDALHDQGQQATEFRSFSATSSETQVLRPDEVPGDWFVHDVALWAPGEVLLFVGEMIVDRLRAFRAPDRARLSVRPPGGSPGDRARREASNAVRGGRLRASRGPRPHRG